MTTIQTPTTIVTGFLGSGKTTLISNLIDELQKAGTKVAYIKNEVGAVDIDTQLLAGKAIQTKELLNGCICCTIVGPFVTAIDELVNSIQPERIIIEASGAADPAALALTVSSHPKLYRDGVVSVVDVTQFEGFSDLSITAQQQTQFTDIIIFNKIEEADLDQKKRVVGYVRELNSHSPIIEAPFGKVPPSILFGYNPSNLESLLTSIAKEESQHLDHVHTDEFETFSITTPTVFKPEAITAFFKEVPKNIFRTKGLFQSPDEQWHVQNGVGGKVTITPLLDKPSITTSTFVFIGKHCKDLEPVLKKKLFEIVGALIIVTVLFSGCTTKNEPNTITTPTDTKPLIGRSQSDDPGIQIIDDTTSN